MHPGQEETRCRCFYAVKGKRTFLVCFYSIFYSLKEEFMSKITAFLKQLPLGRVLMAFLIGTVLLVTTACNTGNEVGARPNNPPVQMGGQNNPYKMGGDGHTQYKMSPDPSVKQSKEQGKGHASLGSLTLAAVNIAPNGADGLLYPGADKAKSAESVNDFISPERQRELMDPSQIPAQSQPVFDRSDPDAHLLEKVGQTFKDASGFLREGKEAIIDNPQ
jgi:hypothetical protein